MKFNQVPRNEMNADMDFERICTFAMYPVEASPITEGRNMQCQKLIQIDAILIEEHLDELHLNSSH